MFLRSEYFRGLEVSYRLTFHQWALCGAQGEIWKFTVTVICKSGVTVGCKDGLVRCLPSFSFAPWPAQVLLVSSGRRVFWSHRRPIWVVVGSICFHQVHEAGDISITGTGGSIGSPLLRSHWSRDMVLHWLFHPDLFGWHPYPDPGKGAHAASDRCNLGVIHRSRHPLPPPQVRTGANPHYRLLGHAVTHTGSPLLLDRQVDRQVEVKIPRTSSRG